MSNKLEADLTGLRKIVLSGAVDLTMGVVGEPTKADEYLTSWRWTANVNMINLISCLGSIEASLVVLWLTKRWSNFVLTSIN